MSFSNKETTGSFFFCYDTKHNNIII